MSTGAGEIRLAFSFGNRCNNILILNTDPSSVGLGWYNPPVKRASTFRPKFTRKYRLSTPCFLLSTANSTVFFEPFNPNDSIRALMTISAPLSRAALSNARARFPMPPTGTFHSPVLFPIR